LAGVAFVGVSHSVIYGMVVLGHCVVAAKLLSESLLVPLSRCEVRNVDELLVVAEDIGEMAEIVTIDADAELTTCITCLWARFILSPLFSVASVSATQT
jgi:hypothetical protein